MKRLIQVLFTLVLTIAVLQFDVPAAGGKRSQTEIKKERELAKTILADRELTMVLEMADAIIETGFNAGDGYGEVWIRDFATFIELACRIHDPQEVRRNLLMFFRFQGDDGNIIDGFIPSSKQSVAYDYILWGQFNHPAGFHAAFRL